MPEEPLPPSRPCLVRILYDICIKLGLEYQAGYLSFAGSFMLYKAPFSRCKSYCIAVSQQQQNSAVLALVCSETRLTEMNEK